MKVKHRWKNIAANSAYFEHQCTKCKRRVAVSVSDAPWHKALTDCPGQETKITCEPLATTPEGAAKQRWPDDKARTTAMLRHAFLEGVTWQRRQYGDQRREIERLTAIKELRVALGEKT